MNVNLNHVREDYTRVFEEKKIEQDELAKLSIHRPEPQPHAELIEYIKETQIGIHRCIMSKESPSDLLLATVNGLLADYRRTLEGVRDE